MSYESKGNKTTSGFDIQEPKPLPASAFGQAKGSISSSVVLERPSQVIIQGAGNFNFKYECTASVGTEGVDTYAAADVVTLTQDDMSLTLPINPCAVSASGDASGTAVSVTFVYKGGL